MPEPHMLGPQVSCWVLTDGKAGDEAQCLGVAQALECTVSVRRIAPRVPFTWAMPWGGIDPREAPGRPGSPIAAPFPDILIASGRRAVPYVRAVKRASRGRTFTVFLKDPRTGTRAADLIWVAQHDRLRGDNVLVTLTAPHRISPQRLAAARAAAPTALAALAHPRVAVLVGGDSRHHRFSDADSARFLGQLSQLAQEGASLMVTTSRRTPPPLAEGLRALIARTGGFMWDAHEDNATDNPYVPILALADSVVVTADSANMAGEAAATGVPVLIFEPSGGHRKFKILLNGLEMCGIARPFRGKLEGNAYLPLDTTATIAAAIAHAFAAHRSHTA